MTEFNSRRFQTLKDLNLPIGHFAVTGSGPLGVRNLREIGDIDVIVSQELWNTLSALYGVITTNNVEKIVIPGKDIEAFHEGSFNADIIPGAPTVAERITEAEVIDGIPFESLEHVLFYKRHMGRDKDLKDIEKINRLLGQRYSIAEMVALIDRGFAGDDITTKPVLGVDDDTIMAPSPAALLADPTTVIGTAEVDGRLVAISVAIPKAKFNPQNPDPKTVYIYYAAVEPSLQGRGLIAVAARVLESKLRALGYAYLEQDCVKDNGYADTISRAYAGAIVEQYDHSKYPEIGPQRFFRIDLNRLADTRVSS